MSGRAGVRQRIERLDWEAVAADLDEQGVATIGPLLTPAECAALRACWSDEARFRKSVVMARHGYGRGEYRYFAEPLPPLVAALRERLYPPLAEVANRWSEVLRLEVRYPADHAAFRARCHEAGQTHPTPLLLRYGPGDYNCLHQDLYGEHAFPLQVAILLSEPEREFSGGELTLTEQRVRMQSRVEVVPLRQGQGAVFPVRHRPVRGTRGYYRVNVRHGVSRLRGGERFTLGVIFHDAR